MALLLYVLITYDYEARQRNPKFDVRHHFATALHAREFVDKNTHNKVQDAEDEQTIIINYLA